MGLVVPVPKHQNLVFPEVEKLCQAAVFDVAVTESLVPAALSLEYGLALWA